MRESEFKSMNTDLASALGKVLIVGGGRMGQAIAGGLLRVEGMKPDALVVANPGEEKRAEIERLYNVQTVAYASEGLPAKTIVIAVKPKHVPDVAQSLIDGGIDDGALVISVAAGISTDRISALLGNKLPIVRVMPNTPLVCGHGMSAISGGAYASDADSELVRSLFAHMGDAIIVAEDQQDIVTALSGSGPAYFELFAETMARSAEKLGMSYETALELILQTMYGTAALISESGQDLRAAIDAVSSPGGTTVAALDAMRSGGLEDALAAGIAAATKRSKELGA